jgi:hypothetical protein
LARLASSGRKTSQRAPSARAAAATAIPALPPEAMTTPAAGIGSERMRLNMPRALKLPPICRCSSLSHNSATSIPSAAPGRRHSGVRRTSPAMRCRAAVMASRSMRGLAGVSDSMRAC